MARIAHLAERLLRSPLLWGTLLWLAIYAAISGSQVQSSLADRFLRAYPIQQFITLLFCIVTVTLTFRGLWLLVEKLAFERTDLGPQVAGGVSTQDGPRLLARLDALPKLLACTYLPQRLRAAVDYVVRKDSAEALEQQLVRLKDSDHERMAHGYALSNLLTWTIPALGVLGTVTACAAAIATFSVDDPSSCASQLSTASDPLALSLTLAVIAGLYRAAIRRWELQILQLVDQRAADDLIGRFQEFGTSNDPHVASVRRMAEQVVRSVERMATEQAHVLRDTIAEGHRHWVEVAQATGNILDNALSTTLHDSLERHAQTLTNGVDRQLTALRGTLESHVALLNSGADRQVAALTEAIHNASHTIGQSATLSAEQASRHLASIASGSQQHMATLEDAIGRHVQQLQAGSSDLIDKLGEGLERMAELLVEALQKHGETLTASEEQLATENRRHLAEVEAALGEAMVVAADRQERLIERSESLLNHMRQALVSTTEAASDHQTQLTRQTEVLLRVVDGTSQVQQLEESLNNNLTSLARMHNLEETLLSLSAAIQLLSARVGHDATPVPRSSFKTSQAA